MLGVEPGASPDDIKAAWRALARRHHPDLIGDDPESAQRATRRMAEINAAYAALTRAGETQEAHSRAARRGHERIGRDRRVGRHHAARRAATAAEDQPVTGRLDSSDNVRPRNQTTTPPGPRIPLSGQPPLRWDRSSPELRASQPSGPMEIRRDPALRAPAAPLSTMPSSTRSSSASSTATPWRDRRVRAVVHRLAGGTLTRDPELAAGAPASSVTS